VAVPVPKSDAGGRAVRRTRILIIEDEPAMVAGLRDNFEYEGYDVISADDGVSGLERALADDPDLLVLDVMMPRMSGLEVCNRSKPSGRQSPSSCSQPEGRRSTRSSDWSWVPTIT
jgi:CheY-like chemotaxis protein